MSTTAAEIAYDAVKGMLAKGQLAAGQKVSQLRIARQLRCSTVPVVEAMRRLESEGLLVKESRKMARVRVFLSEELEGLFLTRQALEMATARMCAQRIEPDEIKKLKALASEFEAAARRREKAKVSQLDIDIHHFITRCARCPFVEQELGRLMLIERTVDAPEWNEDNWDYVQNSHNALVHALANRDADSAEYLMKRHIQIGYEDLLKATKAKQLR